MIRTVMHVDMDAYFASVEQRDFPEYRGKPVVVGADPKKGSGRGVVAAASYEARKYGIHSAMPISRAFRLCPHAVFLRGRYNRYSVVSKAIMLIFKDYTPLVETVSLDEAFLDITGTERLFGTPEQIGRSIKNRILKEQNLTASVGIGPNKLIAKIASEAKKPNGFVIVDPEQVVMFLAPMPVLKLWGVGKKTEEILNNLGIRTIGELAKFPINPLIDQFGKMGKILWEYSHGIDDTPVIGDRETKSMSNEITFEKNIKDSELIQNTLLMLSEKVGYRLRKEKMAGQTVLLKIRISDFSTYVRCSTLSRPVCLTKSIYDEVISLLNSLDLKKQAVRMLGVGVTKLNPLSEFQINMFLSEENGKNEKMTKAVDRIKEKFGEGVIGRGIGNKKQTN